MTWLWILLGALALLLLILIGGSVYMYRFGLSRRPFPWSKEYRDPWAKRPSEPRLVDGKPFNPGGWGDAIVAGEQWMYDTYHQSGRRYYTTSYDGLKLAADYFPPEGDAPRAIILLAQSAAAWIRSGRKIKIHWKIAGKVLYGVFAALVLGIGMCMIMVWNLMIPGILVGIVGIVLLLMLIPMFLGLK